MEGVRGGRDGGEGLKGWGWRMEGVGVKCGRGGGER